MKTVDPILEQVKKQVAEFLEVEPDLLEDADVKNLDDLLEAIESEKENLETYYRELEPLPQKFLASLEGN